MLNYTHPFLDMSRRRVVSSCMKKLLLPTLLLLTLQGMAQHKKTVTATGTAVGTDVIAVKRDALYDAKKNALREAGVAEAVHSFATTYIGSDNSASMQSVGSELSILMLDGQVRLKGEPKYEVTAPNADNLMRATVTIRAEVLEQEASDPEFRIRVSGLQPTYRDGERVAFTVMPYRDCYVRIFWFDQASNAQVEGNMIYPMDKRYYDKPWHTNTEYHYPRLPAEYLRGNPLKVEAYKQTDATMETTLLFVVALKKQIPYNREVCNYGQFIDWLLDIPADQRTVYWQPIGIVR